MYVLRSQKKEALLTSMLPRQGAEVALPKKVLVVDDEDDARNLAKMVLEKNGLSPHCFRWRRGA
jgi:PleD family two-component response regulator